MALELIAQALKDARSAGCTSDRVLSLGYPDILAGPADIARIFGPEIASGLGVRADSQSIRSWHHAGKPGEGVVSAEDLFERLGVQLEVLDITEARGGEMIFDLNEPLPQYLRENYLLVIDGGTLEHCFNIAQAARNVAEMTAARGYVFHGNPVNMYNHGFYNFNPTWYVDFYGANGFEVKFLKLAIEPVSAPQMAEVPPVARFKMKDLGDSSMYCLVQRTSVAPIAWPMQTKYRLNPKLQG
jgi:hypothetical protein